MHADETLALYSQGFRWAPALRQNRPAVPLRFLGRRAALVGGADGVRRFYDPRLSRRDSVPEAIGAVLFGRKAVHGLDGASHHHHKEMYREVLSSDATATMRDRLRHHWQIEQRTWAPGAPVTLVDAAVRVLTASTFDWADIAVSSDDAERRSHQLATVLQGFARPGVAYLRAATARRALNRWAREQISAVRSGELAPAPESALGTVAAHRDAQGDLTSAAAAATALLNLIRPPVAVAWFIAYAAIALEYQPHWRALIASGDDVARRAFAHEVRRHYPFVPVLAARADDEQDVFGVRVPADGYVILDVYGTNHDPACWHQPDTFDPSRFMTDAVPFDALVPQGGGDVATGHRCPGEDLTIAVIEESLTAIAPRSDELPPQDLRIDLTAVPAEPRSGVVLRPRPA